MNRFKKIIRITQGKFFSLSRFLTGITTFLLLCLLFIRCVNAQTGRQDAGKNTETMAPSGFLISLRTPDDLTSRRKVVEALLKITGQWLPVMGVSNNSVSMDLVVIRAGNKSAHELTTQLQDINNVSGVSVVALSKQVKKEELAHVRKLLAEFDLDTRTVSDKELSLFLNAKLEGQYTYYLDRDLRQNRKGLYNMYIKHLEDHPQYSPAWRQESRPKTLGTAQASDTIEIRDVVVHVVEVDDPPPPPPPPPPPAHLSQMTDVQIKQWIRKHDPRKLKDRDIQINRTAEEIIITIKHNDGTETIRYKAKE